MSNMSYCRFENTYNDFEDCRQELLAMSDGLYGDGDPVEPLSVSELSHAQLLLSSVLEIATMLREEGLDLDDPDIGLKASDWLEEVNIKLAKAKRSEGD